MRRFATFLLGAQCTALNLHTQKSCHSQAMPTCMDLNFETISELVSIDTQLRVHFSDILPGLDGVLTSDNYLAQNVSKTGLLAPGLMKINMQPGLTSQYRLTFLTKDGADATAPCFHFSIIDIDCAKNGCQKLTIDMSQFPRFHVAKDPNTVLHEHKEGCVYSFFKTGTERSANAESLPLEGEAKLNTVEFVVDGVSSFVYTFQANEGTRGSSTFLAGASGVGPDPIEPTPQCPYGSEMVTMSSFLPTEVYENSVNCPKGRVIKVCWNPSDYSLGQGHGKYGKDKLQNTAYFGPQGVVKYQIQVITVEKHMLTKQKLLDLGCDIFQIGLNEHDSWGPAFGTGELNAAQVAEIRSWAAMSSQHTVLAFQSYLQGFGEYGPSSNDATNPMIATQLGQSFLHNGPFGDSSQFNQGGGWKGTLSDLDPDACVLIEDSNRWGARAVFVIDMEYNSVFISDVDIITDYGGLSNGNGFSSTNDKVFGNLYAFLIGIVCGGAPTSCDFDESPFERCNNPPR